MSGFNLQKLEALLERVRRNRSAAPVRANAPTAMARTAAPMPTTPPTPKAPPVLASAPAPSVEPPAYVVRAEPPRVEPPPYIEPPPRIEPPHVEAPASVAPPPELPPSITTPSWQPEPGSAVQARPTSVPPMEISDDDLLEVSTLPPDAGPDDEESPQIEIAASRGEGAAIEPEEEELPPASSRRFKVPESLDEGMTGAAQRESEREIPVKTPPPESGPQEALPATGLEAARMPDVAELEADLSGPPSMGPTAEQLGETIELDSPRGPELEIDVTVVAEEAPSVPAPAEELEVSLPRASLQSGLYDVAAAAAAAPAVSVEVPPAAARSAEEVGPERVSRALVGATDVAQVSLTTPSAPRTFMELLDASLGL